MAHPDEVIAAAQPGDTVIYRLRGPATDDEIRELAAELAAAYPALRFEISAGYEQSSAEVVPSG